jgi:hypothetical protein
MQRRNLPRLRPKNLRIQANVTHTFGPLLISLAIILLTLGGFLLESSVTHRLESDAASILFGSVIFACGLLLVSFLLRSLRDSPSFVARKESTSTSEPPTVPRGSPSAKVLPQTAPSPRPFHRFYVDETRVSR